MAGDILIFLFFLSAAIAFICVCGAIDQMFLQPIGKWIMKQRGRK